MVTPSNEPLKTEEARPTYGYRKPSGEYRVVDYLADEYGFSRIHNHQSLPSTISTSKTSDRMTTTTTSVPPTTVRSSPISAFPEVSNEYDDPIGFSPPPAPIPTPVVSHRSALLKSNRASHQLPIVQQKERLSDDRNNFLAQEIEESGNQEFRDDVQQKIEQEKEPRLPPPSAPPSFRLQRYQSKGLPQPPPPPPPSTEPTTTTSTTTTMAPTTSGREIEGRSERLRQQKFTDTPLPAPIFQGTAAKTRLGSKRVPSRKLAKQIASKSSPPSARISKSVQDKITLHQMISESMPTLDISVVPMYFVNKASNKVMAIPYLVMRSTSKMPLLPGMFSRNEGSESLGQTTTASDVMNQFSQMINFQNVFTPHKIQRSKSRSGSQLSSILGKTSQLQSEDDVELLRGQQKAESDDLETEDVASSDITKSFQEQSRQSSDPSGPEVSQSAAVSSLIEGQDDHDNVWWRK